MLAVLAVLAGCSDGGDGESGDGEAAEGATTTSAGPMSGDLRIANLNVLHGLPLGNCPPETAGCQAAARLDAVWTFVEDAGCPDVLTFQEVGPEQQRGIPETLPDVCGGVYRVASETGRLPTEQWILTSLPVERTASTALAGISRSAQLVTVQSDLGPVDVVTTHFVADIDDGPCTGELCPSGLCEPGTEAGECNAIEVLDFVSREADPDTPTVLAGDLNDEVTGPRLARLLDAGFVDVWTLAGNDECEPSTSTNCTSGQRGDGPYDGLDVPTSTRDSRIDFVLVRTPDDCEVSADSPDDADGDGTSTGMFAGEPFDPPVAGVVWASDHTGVQADLSCG